MPIGYTSDVQSGKITTLHDFAMRCARAFDACITMRNDSHDAIIPERFEPHIDYYDERITQAQETLAELPNFATSECEYRAAIEHANALDEHHKYLREKRESKDRYGKMLILVEQWQVPAELAELKKFMRDQLVQSIDFDCNERYMPAEPVLKSGEDWRRSKLLEAAKDLAYGLEHKADEIRRTEERNNWLAILRRTLT